MKGHAFQSRKSFVMQYILRALVFFFCHSLSKARGEDPWSFPFLVMGGQGEKWPYHSRGGGSEKRESTGLNTRSTAQTRSLADY